MQTTLPELSRKPQKRFLPGIFLEESERSRALWIVPDDGLMDRAISRIAEDDSSWLLRRPGQDAGWSEVLASDWVAEVENAVNNLGVTDVYLCGHSLQEPAGESVDLRRFGLPADAGSSLMRRLQRFQLRADRSKRHLIDELSLLRHEPAVAAAVEEGRLELHGLFYHCESGVFLRFDHFGDHFEPLDASSCAAL